MEVQATSFQKMQASSESSSVFYERVWKLLKSLVNM